MKIWVLGREYPKDYNNMCGSFELEQAQMLAFDNEVFYPASDIYSIKRWRKWGLEKFTDKNVKVYKYNIPLGKASGSVQEWVKYTSLNKVFRRIINECGYPDIIHVHYPAIWDYKYLIPLRDKGVKIVCTEHWSQVQTKNIDEKCLENLKWFAKKADSFICVGKPLKNAVLELTHVDRKIEVIPNIVPSTYFNNKIMKNNGTFRFVAIGRLVKGKRFDLLIKAFSDVFKDSADVELDIIGDGDQREILQKIIKDIKGRNIHLLGLMNRSQIADYYKKCNALVLSSNLETFGIPIIEAMANGMPVVTTNAIGFLEYMNVSNSIVVEVDNKLQLEKAMLQLYENYEHYDREKIAAYAKENFGEDVISQRIQNIYRKLLK